jgi:hypothetical protein
MIPVRFLVANQLLRCGVSVVLGAAVVATLTELVVLAASRGA